MLQKYSSSISFLLFLLFVFVGHAQVTNVEVRSITVKGLLKCGNIPAQGVKVALYRVDSKNASQVMNERETSPTGQFELTANTNGRPIDEVEMEPVLKFYHRCDVAENKKKDSYRSFKLTVPKSHVTLGKTPKKTYDIGTLNLQVIYPKESWEKVAQKN